MYVIVVSVHLLVGVGCVPDKSKLENTQLHFLEYTHYCTQSSPQNAGNCILGLSITKCSGGACPQTPTEKKDLHWGSLMIRPITLFKPAGYFNYY